MRILDLGFGIQGFRVSQVEIAWTMEARRESKEGHGDEHVYIYTYIYREI